MHKGQSCRPGQLTGELTARTLHSSHSATIHLPLFTRHYSRCHYSLCHYSLCHYSLCSLFTDAVLYILYYALHMLLFTMRHSATMRRSLLSSFWQRESRSTFRRRRNNRPTAYRPQTALYYSTPQANAESRCETNAIDSDTTGEGNSNF